MTSRRIVIGLLVSALLGATSVAGTVRADPPKQAEEKKPKRSAPPPAKAKPKPKPAAPVTKEPAKHASPEATPAPAGPARAAATSHDVVEHESRIEFDERMVRGQSAAGAIFLFQRAPSDFKSIVDVPTSFRERTIELVRTRRGAP